MPCLELFFIMSYFLANYITICTGNSPCSPLGPGEYKGTLPTLVFSVQEMTSRDLESILESSTPTALDRIRSVLQLHGNLSSGDYTLRIDDYRFFNPLDYFKWVSDAGNTYLQLKAGLDRDGFTASPNDDLDLIPFTLTCIPFNKTAVDGITYDASIYITDVNDNAPIFVNIPDPINITETTPKGSIIARLSAMDKDSNRDKNMTFSLLSATNTFAIDSISGDLTLKKVLDIDRVDTNTSFVVEVMVVDGGPPPYLSAITTLEVLVSDADDQDPAFEYPGCFQHEAQCAWPKYTSSLRVKQNIPLDVLPVPNTGQGVVPIRARDLDRGVGSDIVFSIASTIPTGHEHEFRVDTAKLSGGFHEATITPMESKEYSEGFEIFLKAEEQTVNKHFAVAMIYFQNVHPQLNDKSANKTPKKHGESCTDREMGLVAACAVLSTLAFCLVVALGCTYLRRYEPKSKGEEYGMNTQM